MALSSLSQDRWSFAASGYLLRHPTHHLAQSLMCTLTPGKKQRAGNTAENVRRSKASSGGSQVRAKKQGHSLGSHREFQGFFTSGSQGVRSTETRGSKAKGADSQGLTVAVARGGLGEEVSNPGRLGPNCSCQTHSESQIPASGA